MSKLSNYNDSKKLFEFIQRFWDAITLLEERQEVISFLQDLLTPTEIRMLAKRLQIADMLAKGYKYEDIRNYASVTVQTISSVNNKLNFGNDGFIKVLRKLEKIDQKRQERLEGKRDLLSQPTGLGRATSNLLSSEISKNIRHRQKVKSILKS